MKQRLPDAEQLEPRKKGDNIFYLNKLKASKNSECNETLTLHKNSAITSKFTMSQNTWY